MIHHFFGSKEKVFLTAARIPIDPDTVLAILLAGPREQFPERLVTAFGAAWRDDRTGPGPQSVLRAAVARPQEASTVRVFAEQFMLPRVSAYLGLPDPGRRRGCHAARPRRRYVPARHRAACVRVR